jgi:hypothetical protein
MMLKITTYMDVISLGLTQEELKKWERENTI